MLSYLAGKSFPAVVLSYLSIKRDQCTQQKALFPDNGRRLSLGLIKDRAITNSVDYGHYALLSRESKNANYIFFKQEESVKGYLVQIKVHESFFNVVVF